MQTVLLRSCWLGLILGCIISVRPLWAGSNLVFNGSFDLGLEGWQTRYDGPGESWYRDNHQFVTVVASESGRRDVLRLHVKDQFTADNPGIKADSRPIPVTPGGRYRFQATARTTGPNCRILLEGYRWHPKAKRNESPKLYDLRKVYKFEQLYFGPVPGGTMGGVGRAWKTATATLPQPAKGKLQAELFDSIEFLVVHIVAIGGGPGDLFVDDVILERLP
ncbi:MAG: hypothetical protein RMM51_08485 [Verrucomicrobiae bacterium]|nr:hypothetical protein [Verrucomicrobiae bacterium]